ncbi:MaoC family dehydratase [Nocardia speluncae]|uniref:MaoC family dehydratase n=1 Tax=Nocardia speluncae TaxID=419477 RepID=A0A846XBH8_9NOCA|nr:MaoC family dehydratase [Nocardia speluncae]NKY32777.1 MaoC family dehydratase [Nocardia speluncae]
MTAVDFHTTHLSNLGELDALAGSSLGTSAWFTVDQNRIQTFADATDDQQWIHTDPERAAAESPFGGPIAHGYLTLSLIIPMWDEILTVDSVTMAVNYGLNKVRFTNPVPAGSRIRLNAGLKSVETLPKNGVQVVIDGKIEIENTERPAVIAEAIYRFFE